MHVEVMERAFPRRLLVIVKVRLLHLVKQVCDFSVELVKVQKIRVLDIAEHLHGVLLLVLGRVGG